MPGKLVDDREAPERRNPLEAAGFVVRRLAVADVQFDTPDSGLVLIECKHLGQFLEDMRTGQMMRQTMRMVEASLHPWLLLAGRWWCDEATGRFLGPSGYTVLQAANYLATLQDVGLRYEKVTDDAATVRRILELYRYYQDGVHPSTIRHLGGAPELRILDMVPRVGEATGRKLLDHYGSLAAVFGASQESLQAIPGIGPYLAAVIHGFSHKPWEQGEGGKTDAFTGMGEPDKGSPK